MKPAPFAYARPDTIDEAVALLAEHGDDAAVLAGGQSLVPMLALRLTQPAVLVDINRIAGLGDCNIEADGWRFGALARHADILAAVQESRPGHLLARALPHVAHPAIRNRGTVGGSLALADPAAEWPALAVCLDAEIALAGPQDRRTVAADAFVEGVYATARAPDELVTAIRLPAPQAGTRYAFHEVARRHGDYAIVGLAARRDPAGEARVVVFGAGERPQRLVEVEAAIDEGTAPERVVTALGDTLEIAPEPIYGEAYKRQLTAALVRRALTELEENP